MFSKHLAHSRWQPQLPFSLRFRLHFPSVCLPLLSTFCFCFWRWGGSRQAPQSHLWLAELGAQIVGRLQGRGDLDSHLPRQGGLGRPVPTRVCLSLLGQTGLQHDLRGARELVPGPGLTFLEQLLGTRWCADCQGHRRRVQPCPPGAPSPVGNQGTWGRNDGAWMRSASGSAGSWRLCERGRCLG